jgi:hypothetical protein
MPGRSVTGLILVALLYDWAATPPRLSAQARPWSAGVEAAWNGFSGGVTNQAGSRILPSNRFAFSAIGARELGRWQLRLEAGVAGGHLVGRDSASTVELARRDTGMSRYRIEPLVGREVAGLGSGSLLVSLGPTLDWWRLEGNTRFTIGGEIRVAVQAPLGRVLLENYLGLGIAPQPFPTVELAPDVTTHTLSTLALGLSLRWRF